MRGEYLSYATDIVFNMPSPWGWFEVVWWRHGSAPVTTIFVAIGLITNVTLVVTSFQKWWGSLATLAAVNAVFGFFALGGAIGCRGDGCELAQTWMVAMTWQLAFIEIALGFFVLSATGHIISIAEEMYHAVRPVWRKLDAEWKFYILCIPAFFTAILPMAYAVFAGVVFANMFPFELLRSMMHDPLWMSIWTASLVVLLPGMWIAVRSEWCRDHAY